MTTAPICPEDPHQNRLKELVAAIRRLGRRDTSAYRALLEYALFDQLGREQLYYGLVEAGLPESSACEISLISDHLDLALSVHSGEMTITGALRQARAREKGLTPPNPDELQLLRAADRLLELFPADRHWEFDCGAWVLTFTPSPPDTGAGPREPAA